MDDFERLGKKAGPDKSSDNIAHLEERLEHERDGRREERFLWLVVVLFLVDWLVFQDVTTWAAVICMFSLQLIVLLILARKWGVDEVHVWLDKVLESYRRKNDK